MKKILFLLLSFLLSPLLLLANEADLKIPKFNQFQVQLLLSLAIPIILIGILFALFQYFRIKKSPVHKKMADVSATIFQTCKTYLIQQGKFLLILLLFIAACVAFYFGYLQNMSLGDVSLILLWVVVGISGSYGVAWFGIRMNTLANSRMAFNALRNNPRTLLSIPLRSGMSIGVLLICVELFLMLFILLFIPRGLAGACFIGFAIGESLGASALRIAGGIFTKIADIGSDLMKVVFKIKEDDPRNPGVIADCTGDNAGDSVGPTADGFETYGVTGVALISFVALAVGLASLNFSEAARLSLQSNFLVWLFVMRILMIGTSIVSYWLNNILVRLFYLKEAKPDFEKPLTSLVWVTSLLSIAVTFWASYLLIGPGTDIGLRSNNIWLVLSAIISCGTLGAALIPEFTKIFTSPKSAHVQETVSASREGGASLNILSGFVAGNFSAFWEGLVFLVLMFSAFYFSHFGLNQFMIYPSIFAFGLVAFGFLGMGPVTIAVDSYGPVTDNAQSVYELSLIEEDPETSTREIRKQFGFDPRWGKAKDLLEANDGAGNTFKATAKPVLIGTAVVGSTTMIFSLILLIQNKLGVNPSEILNVLNPWSILGLIAGGMVIYWFTAASTQAVSVGAYKAVAYIKDNINLDPGADLKASTETSKEVVKICTQYAQKGMLNIFVAIFCFALAFAFLSASTGFDDAPNYQAISFFVYYLISIAMFGLFQAIFMANAGGCWDNAKKVVEVDLKEKGTALHDATIIGDTVGDPFKDTSSVSMNPIIKFTTLFGMLAMEIAISANFISKAPYIGLVFFAIALYFVWRSFYKMRIPKQ